MSSLLGTCHESTNSSPTTWNVPIVTIKDDATYANRVYQHEVGHAQNHIMYYVGNSYYMEMKLEMEAQDAVLALAQELEQGQPIPIEGNEHTERLISYAMRRAKDEVLAEMNTATGSSGVHTRQNLLAVGGVYDYFKALGLDKNNAAYEAVWNLYARELSSYVTDVTSLEQVYRENPVLFGERREQLRYILTMYPIQNWPKLLRDTCLIDEVNALQHASMEYQRCSRYTDTIPQDLVEQETFEQFGTVKSRYYKLLDEMRDNPSRLHLEHALQMGKELQALADDLQYKYDLRDDTTQFEVEF